MTTARHPGRLFRLVAAVLLSGTGALATEPAPPPSWQERFDRALADVDQAIAHLHATGDHTAAEAMSARREDFANAPHAAYTGVRGSRPEVHVVQLLESPGIAKALLEMDDDASAAARADFPTDVHVTYEGAPIVLVVCAERGNRAIVRQDAAVVIDAVLLDHPGDVEVAGLLPLVQMLPLERRDRRKLGWSPCVLDGYDGRHEFPVTGRLVDAVRRATSLPIATWSTPEAVGSGVVIGPESDAWRLQHVLYRFDDLLRAARAVLLRERPVVARSRSTVRSPGHDQMSPAALYLTAVGDERPQMVRIDERGVWSDDGGEPRRIAELPPGGRTIAAAAIDTRRRRLIATASDPLDGLSVLDLVRGTWSAVHVESASDAPSPLEGFRERQKELMRRIQQDPPDTAALEELRSSVDSPFELTRLMSERLERERHDVVLALQRGVEQTLGRGTVAAAMYDRKADALQMLLADERGDAAAIATVRAGAILPASGGAPVADLEPETAIQLWQTFPVANGALTAERLADDTLLVSVGDGTGELTRSHAIDPNSGREIASWPSRTAHPECPADAANAALELGWEDGWDVFDAGSGSTPQRLWRSDEAGRGPYVTARGDTAFAALDPARAYAGVVFQRCAWRRVWGAPIPPDGVPGLVALTADRLAVYQSTTRQLAVLDPASAHWRSLGTQSPLAERQRCCPHVALGERLLVWGGEERATPAARTRDAQGAAPAPDVTFASMVPDDDQDGRSTCLPVIARGKSGHAIRGEAQPGLRDGGIVDLRDGSWTRIAEAPFPYRFGMPWTTWQQRLIVLDDTRADQVWEYDPASNQWSSLPSPPFVPGCRATIGVVGDELIVIERGVGRSAARSAALQLPSGRWRMLEPSPLTARDEVVTHAAGGRLVLWGGIDARTGAAANDGALLDPATGRWSLLPPAPGGVPVSRWAGASPVQRLPERLLPHGGRWDERAIRAEDF